jgi:hypothetical protein
VTTPRKKPAHTDAAAEQPAVDAAPDGLTVVAAPVEAPAPAAAPLDPPAPAPAPEQAPDGLGVSSVATGVMLAEHTAANVPLSLIIDANTSQAPAVDGLFEAVTPAGSARACTKRLTQRVYSAGGRFDDYLLLPPGAVLSVEEADRIVAVIAAQGDTGLPL